MKHIKQKQKKLGIFIALFIAIVIIFGGIFTFIKDFSSRTTKQFQRVESQIARINEKIRLSDSTNVEFADAIELWQTLPPSEKQLSGLRINDAKDMLDLFKEDYALGNLDVTFSKPEEIQNKALKKENVAVIASKIDMSFGAPTDAHVYNFLRALMRYFPGHIQIMKFSLDKTQDVTEELIFRLTSGEPQYAVSGSISLRWWDFKETLVAQ